MAGSHDNTFSDDQGQTWFCTCGTQLDYSGMEPESAWTVHIRNVLP